MPLFCAKCKLLGASSKHNNATVYITNKWRVHWSDTNVDHNKFYNSLVIKRTNFTGKGLSIQYKTIYNTKICNAHNVCQLAEAAASCVSTRSCRNLHEHLHLAGYSISSQKIQCSISNIPNCFRDVCVAEKWWLFVSHNVKYSVDGWLHLTDDVTCSMRRRLHIIQRCSHLTKFHKFHQ